MKAVLSENGLWPEVGDGRKVLDPGNPIVLEGVADPGAMQERVVAYLSSGARVEKTMGIDAGKGMECAILKVYGPGGDFRMR